MTSASWWTCQGCGTTYSTNDPDLITGHVQGCDYADGAGCPVELTVKFSAVHWYITLVRSDRLAAVTAARPFAELRGPVDEDDEAGLAEFLAELAEEAGLAEFLAELAEEADPAMADGFRIGDVYPAQVGPMGPLARTRAPVLAPAWQRVYIRQRDQRQTGKPDHRACPC